MENRKHLGLRISGELHYKITYISKYEGRSTNSQILYLIRKKIFEFENEHGEIKIENKND